MIKERLARLRDLMQQNSVQAYIIPSTDPHQSEYVPALWQRRPFISGFTGSAGDVVVTKELAGLWTDSRYFLQAEQQLDSEVLTLFRVGLPDVPSFEDWLVSTLAKGDAVGLDPRLTSYNGYKKLAARLAERGIELAPVDQNLVDAIWDERPAPPSAAVAPQEIRYAGESLEDKLNRLREKMAAEDTAAHVLTTLDAIAWLFNIRGQDVDFNPVVIAHAIVDATSATLYIDPSKIDDGLSSHLGSAVRLQPYHDFQDGLRGLAKAGSRVWLDPATCNQWVVEQLSPGAELFFKASPVTLFKAIKNDVEIQGFRDAHVRDGVAMVRFFKWLNENVSGGEVTELSIDAKLAEIRGSLELSRGASFATIAGYEGHGAIIHYSATPESSSTVKPKGILLVDSGGQYLDGTTDITRTVALRTPTVEQKDRFTRVLKGLIRITLQPFPQGTAGRQIDSLARLPLWEVGLNFGHGVGHGIGSYLNVHEGPQSISFYRCTGVSLEPGMVTSIEPGFYKEGEYGIRTENLAVVREAPEVTSGETAFRRFETLTLCPIDLLLVDRSLLASDEIAWLNDYHREVRDALSPHLEPDEVAWLKSATKAI